MTPYYDHAGQTIYHGDCREILPQLRPPDVREIITDPVWPNASVPLAGCENPEQLMREMFDALPSHCARIAIHLGCDSDPRFLRAVPEYIPFFRTVTLDLARVGYKGRLLMTGDTGYLFGAPPSSRPGAHVIPGRCMDSDGKGKQADHPCPRKLKHVSWLVHWWTEASPDCIVCDPFMGSGTSLVAAKSQQKRAIGIEVEERHCETSAKRLAQEMLSL